MAFPLVTAFLKDLIKRTLLEKAQANTTGDSANLGLVTKLLGVGEGEGKTKENKGSLTKAFANRMKDYVGEQINPAGMQFNQQNQTVAQPQEQFVGQSVMEYAPNQQPATIPQEYANMAQAGQPTPQPTQDVNQTIGWGRGAIDALTGQPQPEGIYSPKLRQGRKTAYYAGGIIPNIIMSKLGQPSPAEATSRENLNAYYRSGQPVVTIDEKGNLKTSGNIPARSKLITPSQMVTPEQKMKYELETAAGKERIQAEGKGLEVNKKLFTAVKRLALLNKQFNKAFPSGDNTPLEQRISGFGSRLGVKYGLIDNPELNALQSNIRPIAINLIRLFGEVGNLSESEQQGAIDTVNQSGLTTNERIAKTKQFIEFALAGVDENSFNYLNSQKQIKGILDAYGVDLGQPNQKDVQSELDEINKRLRELGG